MSKKILIEGDVFANYLEDRPRVIVATDQEPIEHELRYKIRGSSARTYGYVSGDCLEFVLPAEALSILRSGGGFVVGNLGGSEKAYEARLAGLSDEIKSLCRSVKSKIGRHLSLGC